MTYVSKFNVGTGSRIDLQNISEIQKMQSALKLIIFETLRQSGCNMRLLS